MQKLITDLTYPLVKAARNSFGGKDRSAYQPFIIISSGRAGSTFLVERLNSHPKMICFAEVMHPNTIGWYSEWRPRSGRMRRLRDTAPKAFWLNQVWDRQWRGTQAVGAKILFLGLTAQLDFLRDLLTDVPNAKVIFLSRRNVLSYVVSALAAKSTGQYQLREGEVAPNTATVKIEPEQLSAAQAMMKASALAVDHLLPHERVLKITYEDLVGKTAQVDAQLLNFLGISHAPLASGIVKLSNRPISERIENYAALAAHFEGTGYAQYFEDRGGDAQKE
ncbi:MAG: Stf0 family sulfotransferase [Pseudomonadota bacterium]